MFSKKLSIVVAGFFLVSFPVWARSERTRIELADRTVEGLIDHPDTEGPHPFLIVAAGEEGDIQNRLYEKLVAGAVTDDFVTLRLDWSYKKKKGAASPGLKLEAEELGVIINQIVGSRMLKQYEVDTTKVALIAKGLGAKVAMIPDSGGAGEKIKATLLLNPVCDTNPNSFTTTYTPFLAAKTPRMIVASRGGNCPLPQIYAAAKDFGDSVMLFTIEGDSLFTVGKNLANQDTAIAASLNWLKNQGWSTPKPKTKKPDAKKHQHDAQAAGTHP